MICLNYLRFFQFTEKYNRDSSGTSIEITDMFFGSGALEGRFFVWPQGGNIREKMSKPVSV
jgi:hypothetical protein